ncbi:hypothetical protein OSB04_028816 [Centaurea solstitialis]|uniref:Reverse transcriptase Ty1/copia-type domain-containing protein n=1 Tax=Centaurea solstitialis TaxID=347529 RepID=A0AA38SGI2_9ASTR|nr:hypothetical protein OSB04_028816 [Centaurea solstitialis]
MYDNLVWTLVDIIPGQRTMGCKWIFKKKTDMDGKVHTYKARLVAKGYTQTQGIDYDETFSLVANINSIRIMLAIAAFHDYEIWQMDVKTAFLNGKLTEDVYMAQPEVFENAKHPKRVCKLEKAIYGLNRPLVAGISASMRESKSLVFLEAKMSLVFLVYGGEKELKVTGYCDASWQTDKDDSQSQSGWVYLLNGGAVIWNSTKQDTVADSTCEFEYIAACEASKEAIWMSNFIGDLGVVPTIQDAIEIFCDNKSAVALTKEPKDHEKSKHIERKYHFVRSKVEEGHVIVKHIRSEDNPVDPFTKALAKSIHDEHARFIGLRDKIEF